MRSVEELMNLTPDEMSPEEQAFLYENLKNTLIGKGALDSRNRLTAAPLATVKAHHVLPERLGDLQALTKSARGGGERPAPMPVPVHGLRDFLPLGVRNILPAPGSGTDRLLQALPSAAAGVIGDAVGNASPGGIVERFMEGGAPAKPTNPAQALDKGKTAPVQPSATPAGPTTHSVMSSRIGPDGKVTFTNSIVNNEDQKAIADAEKMYQRGVAKWKGQALRYRDQVDLADTAGEPTYHGSPLSKIVNRSGQPSQDFRVLPGPGGFAAGGDVPTPTGAPSEWGSMSPAQRDQWLADQTAVTGPAQGALNTRKTAAEVRDVEHPTEAALRTADEIARRGKAAVQGDSTPDAVVAVAKMRNPKLTPAEEALIRKKAEADVIAKEEANQERRNIMANPAAGATVLRGGLGLP